MQIYIVVFRFKTCSLVGDCLPVLQRSLVQRQYAIFCHYPEDHTHVSYICIYSNTGQNFLTVNYNIMCSKAAINQLIYIIQKFSSQKLFMCSCLKMHLFICTVACLT